MSISPITPAKTSEITLPGVGRRSDPGDDFSKLLAEADGRNDASSAKPAQELRGDERAQRREPIVKSDRREPVDAPRKPREVAKPTRRDDADGVPQETPAPRPSDDPAGQPCITKDCSAGGKGPSASPTETTAGSEAGDETGDVVDASEAGATADWVNASLLAGTNPPAQVAASPVESAQPGSQQAGRAISTVKAKASGITQDAHVQAAPLIAGAADGEADSTAVVSTSMALNSEAQSEGDGELEHETRGASFSSVKESGGVKLGEGWTHVFENLARDTAVAATPPESQATQAVRQQPTAPQLQAPPPAADPGDPNIAVVSRGLRGVMNQQGGSLTLRLSPSEMGQVRVQMDIRDGVASVRLQAQEESARSLLGGQLGTLREAIEKHGLRVDRLEVQPLPQQNTGSSLSDARQGSGEQALRDDGRSRGGFDNHGSPSRDTRRESRSMGDATTPRFSDLVNALG